jgi:hypothetical protein
LVWTTGSTSAGCSGGAKLATVGATQEPTYFLEHKEALIRFTESNKEKLNAGHVVLAVKKEDGIGDPYAFALNGRMHFIFSRGFPIGKTKEVIYTPGGSDAAAVVADYLDAGQQVYEVRSLGNGWIYVFYNDV